MEEAEILLRNAMEHHGAAVYRLALCRMQSVQDAEDVYQDVFLRLLGQEASAWDGEHLRAWLLRCTVNRCHDLHRFRLRRPVLALADLPETAAEADSGAAELWDAVARLPEKLRVPIHLYYAEGYSTEEIAGLLDIPAATVRTRLRRARKRLKDLLGGDDHEEERLSEFDGAYPAPAGLNDRVLSAARQTAGAQKETTGPKHLAPGKRRPVLRAAVCAACALALVVGSVTLGPIGGGEPGESGAPVTALPSFSFGLTAYAADTGERYEANANGGLAFSTAGQVSWSAEGGHYTGCLFQVTGENIRTISLAIDREALYRSRTLTNLSREEVQNYLDAEANGTEYRLSSGEGVIHAVYGEEEEGPLTMEVVTDLGAAVTEGYDPEVRYGFLIPDTGDIDWDRDPRAANQESIDRMDGAGLTVTVTFTDGSEQTKTYTLSTGRLKVEYDANSPGGILLPQLAGDEDPWLYGVYAVDETASRFLQWPVQGANTISLSNPYGTPRWQPGGKTCETHTGIDIAAPEGEAVLAAAGGTVVESGYDVERGNYVVIDHGDGLSTLYGQCRDFTVEEGDTVRAGEMIGAVGKTGMATGAHLHFEVRQDGEPQNPVAYFDSDVRDTLRMG